MSDTKKASALSIAQRKTVCGVGLNDSEHMTSGCPFYKRWVRMIERCYSDSKENCYKDAYVCKDWLTFSNFKSWMTEQDWEGKELDKDLLSNGDKVYSPETCIFIEKKINLLLTDQKKLKGKYAKGVYFKKSNQKFVAQCAVNGKEKHIGYYSTESEAESAYKKFKTNLIFNVAKEQDEPLKSALLRYKV